MATLTAKQVASGLSRPVFATAPPGDTKRLFILEQHTGRIQILNLQTGKLNPDPFLTVAGVGRANEQGLLGLAFHPKYADNGLFFIYFVDAARNTNLRRYKVSATADVADAASATTILKFPRPFANHNGGWIGFGPKDGFLYVASGDGGSEGDPNRFGQNKNVLLGKLLRIDVNGNDFANDPDRNYAIPASNPFRQQANCRPEIWAYGLRNPWRCSFDRETGDLYIADVGQDQWEEINFQRANSAGGENYGWRVREGKHDTGLEPGSPGPFIDPIHEYDHKTGIAIIGGYVYRGNALPSLKGAYLFADNTGPIWSLRHDGTTVTELTALQDMLFPSGGPASISSFAEDGAGELYLLNLTPGQVFQLMGQPAPGPQMAAAGRGPFGSVQWTRPVQMASFNEAPQKNSVAAGVGAIGFPEVPGVSAVQEARILLQVAAEVEHALLVQYLYAAYSLDPTAAPSAAWQAKIRNIAREEMGHLITVQNLLLAIGGEPYLDRTLAPGIPLSAAWDPFKLTFEPLGLTALAKYVTAESPLPDQLPPDLLNRASAAYQLARLSIGSKEGVASTVPGINHVGVLYARLYWLFQENETPTGPWASGLQAGVFPNRHLQPADVVGNLDHQATLDETQQGEDDETFHEGKIYAKTIRSLEDARTALYFIAAQGEGWTGPAADSHFERFLGIFEDYPVQVEAGWEPTLPVPVNPTIGDQPLSDPVQERNRITHRGAQMWADLFNTRYWMLLGELALALRLPQADPNRQVLFNQSIQTEMKRAVAEIAQRLAGLPRKANPAGADVGKAAGAPFQLPATGIPSDADQLRAFLKQQIATAAMQIARLRSQDNPVPLTQRDKSRLSALVNADTNGLGPAL